MGRHRAFTRVPRADWALGWAHGTGGHLESGLKSVAPFTTSRASQALLQLRSATAVAFQVVVDHQTNAAASKFIYLRRPGRLGSRRGAHLERAWADDGRPLTNHLQGRLATY